MERLPELVTTERLEIRRWKADDAPRLHEAVTGSVEHLRPWMAWIEFEPLTVDDRRELFVGWERAWSDGGEVVLGIFLPSEGADDQVVGGTGLHRRGEPNTLEIGYWIAHHHVGQGFATEVAQGLTTAALAIPGIDQVEIHHDKANVRSAGVPTRLGYKLASEAPHEVLAPGEVGINCRWVMTDDRWPRPEPDPS